MGKILHFQCREPRFDPWSGNKDPTCRRVWTKKKRQGRKRRKEKAKEEMGGEGKRRKTRRKSLCK